MEIHNQLWISMNNWISIIRIMEIHKGWISIIEMMDFHSLIIDLL